MISPKLSPWLTRSCWLISMLPARPTIWASLPILREKIEALGTPRPLLPFLRCDRELPFSKIREAGDLLLTMGAGDVYPDWGTYLRKINFTIKRDVRLRLTSLFCYGDKENACTCASAFETANQSEIYLALCEKVIHLIHSFIHIPFFRFCGWRCGKSDLHNYFPVICRIL